MNHTHLFLYLHLNFLMSAQFPQRDEPLMFFTISLLLDI